MKTSTKRRTLNQIAVTAATAACLVPLTTAQASAGEAPKGATSTSSAGTTDGRPAASASPKAYVAWLEAKAASGDAGASEVEKQFKALPAEKQEKYLDYINDPSHARAFTEALNGKGEFRAERANGDVVIERESDSSASNQTGGIQSLGAQSGSMWATHSVTVKYLGVKATKVTIKTSYYVRGTDTVKVYPGSAWHQNLIPGTDLSNGVVDEWISAEPADNAHSQTVWKFEWWTGIEDTGRHRVWADYSGYKGGYLKVNE
ncbi:hypothetical protein GCM10023347_27710 [Streptomyces chumphonensis]|uniref:hypothetical protein n=1 Tax=Streptomyces chumphonensis TaxID=1214925 RepID=UPI0031EAE911